ncbi:efflux RND transporter periplasmic adaptor subunit [Flavisericum labens]|uniref:efflux RND transporter periplasmic adaptor subunit n=1 Tax=Flavisericum labens TaxID=3377112 RepID=UPI00387AB73C
MKRLYTTLTLAVAFLIASCGSEDKKAVTDNSPVIPVKVSKVTDNNHNPFLSVSGKIQAKNSANLSTRTMGYVNSVPVNVGDKVNKGQLLVAINNVDLQAKRAQVNANITKAAAAYNNAKKDYERFQALFAQNSASQKEVDDMTANYEMAKAGLEAAKQMKTEINAQFAYTNITAPFSGVITSKTVKNGDMANPGQPLISIEAPGDFEVTAMVPETEISGIKKDAKVSVNVKSINQTISGKITEVSTSAAQTGGQYLVKIALDKTDANILSGMFTTVQFPIERKAETSLIIVPKDAIVTNGQLSGIFTVSQSNTAILRWLRLGRTFGNQVEVLSGLNANESYIVSAKGKLFNGVKISL